MVRRAPSARIIVTAIFPRSDKPALMPAIDAINAQLAKLADGRSIRFLNVNAAMTDEQNRLLPGMMSDGLHPAVRGYHQIRPSGYGPEQFRRVREAVQEDGGPQASWSSPAGSAPGAPRAALLRAP